MTSIYSLGLGIGTQNTKGEWLEVFFPQPLLNPEQSIVDSVSGALNYSGGNATIAIDGNALDKLIETLGDSLNVSALKNSERPLVAVILEDDSAPKTAPEVYLKLHLLSHRLVQPHHTTLDGMFGVLPNVAWTNEGAIDINELAGRQLQARIDGRTLSVDCVDKFPKMTDYVVPTGVRIADTARVRLGAHIGEGTKIGRAHV